MLLEDDPNTYWHVASAFLFFRRGRIHLSCISHQKWAQASDFGNHEIAERAHAGRALQVGMHDEVEFRVRSRGSTPELARGRPPTCRAASAMGPIQRLISRRPAHRASNCRGSRSLPVVRPVRNQRPAWLSASSPANSMMACWSRSSHRCGRPWRLMYDWLAKTAHGELAILRAMSASSPGSCMRSATSASPLARSSRRSVMMRSTRKLGVLLAKRLDHRSEQTRRHPLRTGHPQRARQLLSLRHQLPLERLDRSLDVRRRAGTWPCRAR